MSAIAAIGINQTSERVADHRSMIGHDLALTVAPRRIIAEAKVVTTKTIL
jgi:hypothetical protein